LNIKIVMEMKSMSIRATLLEMRNEARRNRDGAKDAKDKEYYRKLAKALDGACNAANRDENCKPANANR
jgi:hypothetical protein